MQACLRCARPECPCCLRFPGNEIERHLSLVAAKFAEASHGIIRFVVVAHRAEPLDDCVEDSLLGEGAGRTEPGRER